MSSSSQPPTLPAEAAWYDVHYQQIQKHLPDWYRYLLPELVKELKPDHRLLELGCGQGHILRLLAHDRVLAEENIFAVDQSQTAVSFVRNHLPKANVQVKDIQQLDYPNNYFDVALLMETIEHLSDPGPALSKIHSVIKPGGVLFLSFPNYLHIPWWIVRILSEKLNRPNWIVLQPIDKIYMVPGIKCLLGKSGFEFERGVGSIYGPPLLYKFEPQALTRLLNAFGLYSLSFHPILKFRKKVSPQL